MLRDAVALLAIVADGVAALVGWVRRKVRKQL